MTAAAHHVQIGVEPADIDLMGHVNNASYLKWVQKAVLDHWNRRAPPEAVAAHVWVALKHEITYRKPAYLDDEVVATVVLQRVQRQTALYETVIRRGEEVLAHVTSRWCCLDAQTLKPTRLAKDIVDRFLGRGQSGD